MFAQSADISQNGQCVATHFLVATLSPASPPFSCQMMHGLHGNNGCMHRAWAAWLSQLRALELIMFCCCDCDQSWANAATKHC